MTQGARKQTISMRRASKTELRRLAVLYPYPRGTERPSTRGDCLPGGHNAERPCPFAGCRYHLALDVNDRGSITLNFPDLELEQLPDTCALDVADRGGAVLDDVGRRMNLTREGSRQIELHALARLPDDALIALQACR